MSSPSKRRDMDVMKLMMSDYTVETINDGITEFNVEFHGPKESLYEGGVWKIRVELPDAYPYKSPSIGFLNKIFHPNVDELSGSVCLDVINQSWSPMFDLLNVFEVFLPQLLLYPNPSDPLNGDAASLMMKDKNQYEQKVKEYCERYAKKENVVGTPKDESDDEISEEEFSGQSDSDDEAGTQHLILARTIGLALHVISSDESNTAVSQSLVVLTSPEVNNGLRFENLLKAPAELLGRGKNGSVYKVMCDNPNMTLVVKRIKDWPISGSEFKKRMQKLDQFRHPNVLPAVAFYSSRQEKLLVYEYQNNGIQTGQTFHWSSKPSIAAGVADALAFMHQELQEDRIAHGNLKSSNILLNKNMEPCISEYGLTNIAEISTSTTACSSNYAFPITDENIGAIFKADIYAFGVILLELLTGKVQNNG
ncbi:hypothetical protein K7X08_027884 [Anisodus acutangulus]|uniref:E2 ubiquitin-conjugating enzyme n=1 Tax=Anisodus acutangulus TaxID=402998 RepID=A0A9Q1RRS4_9SOLA|nr:hypothetical protein K7X08_027884 [Anisodus acutangulus]